MVSSGGLPGPPLPAHNPTCATPGSLARTWFRQVPFRSPLLREYYHFLGVLRWFSSPGSLPKLGLGSARIIVRGLPHSETLGSTPDCGSPSLSLLVCVLHRLVVPRHPPTAHHVLPGHGSLGGRELSPRRCACSVRSNGTYTPSLASTWTLAGRWSIPDRSPQRLNLATYELGKVLRAALPL